MNDKDEILQILDENFECMRCGECCRTCKEIALNDNDLTNLATWYWITQNKALPSAQSSKNEVRKLRKDVQKKYTKIVGGYLFLKKTAPCIFYDDATKTCAVYEFRPLICRQVPFLSQAATHGDFEGVIFFDNCPGALDVEGRLEELGLVRENGD